MTTILLSLALLTQMESKHRHQVPPIPSKQSNYSPSGQLIAPVQSYYFQGGCVSAPTIVVPTYPVRTKVKMRFRVRARRGC